MSVKKQLYSVATISVIDKFIKLGFLAILSRLLTPADLGVVAAALLVVGFAEMFSNAGFGSCIVQNKEISEQYERTALTLSITAGILFALILIACEPLIVSVLGIEELAQAIPSLALILVFRGFSVISSSLLQRKLQIAKLMWIGVGAYIAGAALVAVPMAIYGYGHLSVVVGVLAENFFYMVGLYIASRHSLRPMFDRASSRHLLSKGMGFFTTRTINYFAQNLDYVIVSKMLGSSALGFYSRAYKIMEYPSVIYRNAVDRVLFPLLSREQDNKDYLGQAVVNGLFITTLISVAISAFIVTNSQEIVSLLLGNQWGETAVVLEILAVFSTFRLNCMICITYVRSRGLLRIATWHAVFFMLLVGIFAYLAVPYGIKGVGFGAGLAVLVFSLCYSVHVFRLAEIKLGFLLQIYGFGILVFLWLFGADMLARRFVHFPHALITLVFQACVAVVASLVLLHPRVGFLWGAPGQAFRAQLIFILEALLGKLARPAKLLRVFK
jgi:O-antigen/teichoic acid export membrane protein